MIRCASLLVLVFSGALSLGSCRDMAAGENVSRIVLSTSNLVLLIGADSTIGARAVLATGAFLDGSHIFWSAEHPEIASVDATGRVFGVASGQARVAASAGGRSAVLQVRVTPVPVAAVHVSPPSAGVVVGDSLPFSAAALLISGDTAVGRSVSWRSSRPTVALVDSLGRVHAVAAGAATISATVDGVVGSAAVSVTRLPVAYVVVTPSTERLLVGRAVEMNAVTLAADSTPLTGRSITWTSSVPTVASISAKGVVTALTPVATTITATSEGQRGTARITVVKVPVHSVAVLPTNSSSVVGGSLQLVAAALDSAGGVLGGRVITWRSLTTTLASVDSTGLVKAIGAGAARVAATSEGKSGVAVITITNPPVARVVVRPQSVTLDRGATVQLNAEVYDAAGSVLPGRKITWLSGSTTIARVDQSGLVSGVAKGTVVVLATSEGISGSATVTVK